MEKLFAEITLGDITLKNRLVMAPMTRSRATADGLPGEFAAKYYGQRASMGLIITEGVQPSELGQGYLNTPGIYTDEQAMAWKKVIDSVHEKGGKIFIQLMHVGRMSHPDNLSTHKQAIAPSAIAPGEKMFTLGGMKEIPVPTEIKTEDIPTIVDQYRSAAVLAIKAGADGVEIHGANGYLIHQFLGENSNIRKDNYGGSIENRARFALEVTRAVVEEIGASKVGIRLSPMNHLGNVDEGKYGEDLYRYLVAELAEYDLAYLHLMHVGNESLLEDIRNLWHTRLMVNRAGRPLEDLTVDLDNNLTDLISVGVWSLANPDLVDRLKNGAPLNPPVSDTFYVNQEELGYTDYPTINP
ncbi:alkene reductase [Enterococcus mundtii]|uniref:Alkene reductase n=1 Tax=Enterococcus mundtii TaxID=53346 RepID=A0A848MVT0_ENTMU|nr:alkene reductase [Enterococcus mundtii]NMP59686.1 alkene reductase [Enterococcus mundtii]